MNTPDLTTIDHTVDDRAPRASAPRVLGLTLLWHPDSSRIGAQAELRIHSAPLHLGRNEPDFSDGRPLDDPRVSRSPLELIPTPDGGLELWPSISRLRFALDGVPGEGGERVGVESLERGVVLSLGRGALVLLRAGGALGSRHGYGLVGASAAMGRLVQRIEALAPMESSVLITGPSGTGKELVAHALHRASGRADGPFVAVNLAALISGTAPSQLFGHQRGSFTGAGSAHRGFFQEADGGTLLLDEVGACPTEVQAQLLRALESSEIQPVGGPVRRVDVRVLAATDSVIEDRLCDEDFSAPLYFRLARTKLHIPPLRQRPADIAAQLVHYLRRALADLGAQDHLAPTGAQGQPWLTRETMEAALAHSWPGNTRELISVAGELAHSHAAEPRCGLPHFVRISQHKAEPQPPRRSAGGSTDLERTLRQHNYQLNATARALGVGLATLRRRMSALGIVRAQDLEAEAIQAALTEHGESEAAAAALRVSHHGLKVRMRELGL